MAQTLLPVPEIKIESCGVIFDTSKKNHRGEIVADKKIVMTYSGWDYTHMSEFLIDMSRYSTVRKFIAELESMDVYSAIADHCAREVEDDKIAHSIIYPYSQSWLFSEKEIREIITEKDVKIKDGEKDENPHSDEKIAVLMKKHVKRTDSCIEAFRIDQRINEKIVDTFRKPENFTEFIEHVTGSDGFDTVMNNGARAHRHSERAAISRHAKAITAEEAS